MRTHPKISEYIFTVVSLVFYTGGPLPLLLSGGRSEGMETVTPPDFAFVRLCFQAIYVITLFYLAPSWKKAAYLLIKDKWILLLTIIIFLSILWSVNVGQTLARSVAVLGTTLFGVYFATRYSLKQQLYLLGVVFGLASAISIFFAVALPQYGIMQGIHTGAWRGIYTHKNGLGALMSLSAIAFLILSAFDGKKKWIFPTGLLVSICLLVLSRSSSPLIYLFVIAPIFFALKVLRWECRARVTAVCLLTTLGYALAMLFTLQAEAIANVFGKDLTFTGRTQLWVYVWKLIQKKPWLGYGFSSLWSGSDNETSLIWRIIGWEAPNAHNGFLEIWLSLGILGLSVLVIHIAFTFIKALNIISQTSTVISFFPLIMLLLMLLKNITEYSFMERNSIDWVLYVSAALSLNLKSTIGENTLLLSPLETEEAVSTYNVT
jgi:exopolysaccharide production protein ExoQ